VGTVYRCCLFLCTLALNLKPISLHPLLQAHNRGAESNEGQARAGAADFEAVKFKFGGRL
jgi:hypothetical protein